MNTGVETQRTITTFLSVTPQVVAWLRPRATVSGNFGFNRDPNGRDPVRDVGDTAAPFHCPPAFPKRRPFEAGRSFDLARSGRPLLGASPAVPHMLRPLRAMN